MKMEYEKNGKKIYQKSFSIIRKETNLSSFKKDEEKLVVRIIHSCGMTDIHKKIFFKNNFVEKASKALMNGARILCDTNMIKYGITKSRLPYNNEIMCMLNDEKIYEVSKKIKNTRTAAGVELWKPYLSGSLVAIGNAPTALFHLLELIHKKQCPMPAAIIGFPVGFVGAKESKDALFETDNLPCCIIKGRLGGSAVTVAAVNAIASESEE